MCRVILVRLERSLPENRREAAGESVPATGARRGVRAAAVCAAMAAACLSGGPGRAWGAVADLPDPPAGVAPAAPPAPPAPPPAAPVHRATPPADFDEPMPVPLVPPAAPPAKPAPVAPVPPAPPSPPVRAPAAAAPAPAPPPPAEVGPVPWPAAGPVGRDGQPGGARASLATTGTSSASPAAVEELCRHTKVGVYGSAQLFIEKSADTSAKLPLVAFSVDHHPTDWLRIVAAVQVEDGKTFGVQQALIESSPVRAIGVGAGLMVLPLGLGNLQPEPTAELAVDRPLTDQLIIPAVWRELGAGLFGEVGPGFRYQGAVVGGLDASGFTPLAPLWGARGDGGSLAIHDAAVVGRLELADLPPGLTIGASGYYGAAAHDIPDLSGVRAGVVEGDLRYHRHGLNIRAEYARLYIINSYLVNDYLGLLGQSAVPARGRGFYVELGYDLLQLVSGATKEALELFAGFENVNPRSVMSPYNYNQAAITGPNQLPPEAPSDSRSFVRAGLDYRPRPSIVLKADVQVALNATGLPPGEPLDVAHGAPGTPKAVSAAITDAARGVTRVGLAIGFNF
jgi:hypothetical protein